MSIVLSVEIGSERRVYAPDDLPLSVGGAACHLALADLSDDGPVAFLGHDRGELFIQPAEDRSTAEALTCNGVPLSASRWLDDRDELGIGHHRLRCEIEGETVRLALVEAAPVRPRPPDADAFRPQQAAAADRVITPTDFKPRWQSPPRRSRLSIRPRSLVMIAAVALLVAGAWFVLTAHAIRIETTPPADRLELQGGLLTPKIGDSYLLRPGVYTVAAELEGYRSLAENLEVNGDTPSVVGYVFEALGGLLTVTSKPVDGAEITVDGKPAGVTPARDIEVSAGEHTVDIVAPLHLSYRTTIVFEPGEEPRELAAELVPNWASLSVTTSPANATVSLDGAVVGTTPVEHRVEAGERVVEIRRQGFKPLSRRIQVTAGKAVDLGLLRLAPVDGHLTVASDPTGATVAIDGTFRGTAPLELELAPGATYQVVVSMAGRSTFTTGVEISSGRRSEVRAELELLRGEVSVTSLPPRAQLLIDGVPTGTTDQTLELEARPHQIEIRRRRLRPLSHDSQPGARPPTGGARGAQRGGAGGNACDPQKPSRSRAGAGGTRAFHHGRRPPRAWPTSQ